MQGGMSGVRLDAGDPRFYDPTRDLAHAYPAILLEVRRRFLEGEPWSSYSRAFGPDAPPVAEVGRAMDILVEAVAAAADPDTDTGRVLGELGWWELSDRARIAVQAGVGQVMVMIFADAAKRATFGGRGPCDQVAHVRGLADAAAVASYPSWRRALARWLWRGARAWRVVRGRE